MAEAGRGSGEITCEGVQCGGERKDSEVHPSFRVHHVNSLHVTLGTCQALTPRDWLSSPHCEKQFAGRAS